MNNGKTYTDEQITDAERLAKAIASVPDKKRHAFVRMIKAMMLVAEMAVRLTNQTEKRPA